MQLQHLDINLLLYLIVRLRWYFQKLTLIVLAFFGIVVIDFLSNWTNLEFLILLKKGVTFSFAIQLFTYHGSSFSIDFVVVVFIMRFLSVVGNSPIGMSKIQ